jgi:hypothetical protein
MLVGCTFYKGSLFLFLATYLKVRLLMLNASAFIVLFYRTQVTLLFSIITILIFDYLLNVILFTKVWLLFYDSIYALTKLLVSHNMGFYKEVYSLLQVLSF